MNNTEKLIASQYLVKQADFDFKYRPFNYKDSIPGGLAAAVIGGLGGAAFGKIKDYFSSDEEELDPNSDDYGFKMIERMQKGNKKDKPSSVGSSALKGALAFGLPVALAPSLFGDNPIGRNFLNAVKKLEMEQSSRPEFLKKLEQAAYEASPHAIKQLPFQLAEITF